jgi:hypothetical protein
MPLVILHHLLNVCVQLANKRGLRKKSVSRLCIQCGILNNYNPIGLKTKKKKLRGLSPRVNYTDRATAACRRSDFQLFADRGCHVVSVTDLYGRILGFLDRSRYFSIK